MGRAIYRLTDRQVRAYKKPGRYSDGGGLYLRVEKTGSKSWVFMTASGGRKKEIGLGGLKSVPLVKARQLAAKCREAVADALDPREALRKQSGAPLFVVCASEYISTHEKSWRNPKHRQQWRGISTCGMTNQRMMPGAKSISRTSKDWASAFGYDVTRSVIASRQSRVSLPASIISI